MNRKLQFTFILFFFILLLFTINSNATDTIYLPDIPSEYGNYYFITQSKSSGDIKLNFYNQNINVYSDRIELRPSGTRYTYKFNSEDYCWDFVNSFNNLDVTTFTSDSVNFLYISTSISGYSTLNLSDVNVVFQVPPQEVEGTIILAPVIQETEMNSPLMEIVGILPAILVVLVSLVGLRKALAILFHLLRKS